MTFSTASLLEAVRPLDPELLALGPAGMAPCFRSRASNENSPVAWADDIAHTAAMVLSPAAQEALHGVADRLQALLDAQAALQAAGVVLAEQLEAMGS